MKKPTRILIVEDRAADADLAKHEIRKVLNDCEFKLVKTRQSFLRALETFQPDSILLDHSVPDFDGMNALQLTLQRAPLTPIVIWAGSISEDVAVEFMKAGANNYVLKDNPQRLGPAIIHALEERELLVVRRQAEQALEDSEKRFRALIENGLDDISLLAADGSLLWESPSTVRNLGYPPDEFLGHNIFELVHPDDQAWTHELYARLMQEPGSRQQGKLRLRHSSGTWRWVEAIVTNMLHDPSVNAIVVNYRDITDHRQAEIELEQKNADLALVNALNEAINRGEGVEAVVNLLTKEIKRNFSAEGATIYLLNPNEQVLTMQQYFLSPKIAEKIEKLIGMSIPPIEIPIQEGGYFDNVLRAGRGVITSDPKVIQKWMEEFVETTFLPTPIRGVLRRLIPQIYKILNIQSTILIPLISDGKTIGLLDVSSPNLFTEEDLERIENIGRQLTIAIQRKQVEEALRESQSRYQNLVETSYDLIWSIDAEGRFTFLNRAAREIYGYEPEELMGRSFFEIMDPEYYQPNDLQKFNEMVAQADEFSEFETYVRHRDGRQLILSANCIVMRDEEGKVTGVTGTSHDITIRKRVENVLKDERNLLRTLIDNLPDRIYVMDTNGRKTVSNTADWQASGAKAMEDVIGQTDFDIYPRELAEQFWKADKSVLDSGQPLINYEEPGLDVNGNRASILTTKIPLRDDEGKVTGLVGIGRDITERKQAEDRINDLLVFNEKILNHSPIGILTYRLTGECVFVNENAAAIIGTSVEELKAQNFHSIESWRKSGLYDLITNAVSSQTDLTADIHHVRTFGKDVWMTVHCATFKSKEADHILLSITDITERRQAEIERQALLEIMQGLASTKDLQDLLKLVHHSIAKVTYAENFFVVLYHQDTGLFEEIYSVDKYDPPEPPSKLENSITSYVFRSGEPLLLTQASFDELAAQDQVKLVGTDSASWLGVPLKTSGRIIGVMAVQDYENDNRYSEHDKDVLASIASQVALAIERKQAEEALQRNERRFRALIEKSIDAIVLIQSDGQIAYATPGITGVLGYSVDEYVGRNGLEFIHPDDVESAAITIGSLFQQPGETATILSRERHKDGSWRWVEGSVTNLLDDPSVNALVANFHDITERKLAEESLREEREKAQTYLDIADVIMLALDQNGMVTLINQKGCEILGYEYDEIIGRDWIETFLPEAGRKELHEAFQRLMKGNIQSFGYYENTVITKDGEERLIAWHNTVVQDAQGTIISTLSSGEDITKRKQAENELRLEKERFESIAATAPGVICSVRLRPDGTISMPFASPAIQEVYGLSPQDVYQDATQIYARLHLDDFHQVNTSIIESAQTLQPWHTEFRYQHPAKGEIWIEGQAMPLKERDGSVIWHGFVFDITERKRAEAAEHEQRTLAEALRDTAETLSSTLDYGEVLDHILTAVGRVVPHNAGSILLIEGEFARVVRSQGYDKHGFNPEIMGIRLPLAETTNLRQMLNTRQPEVVYDTRSYPGWKRMSSTDWLRSSVGAPISIYGEVLGFICLDSQTPEFFTPVHAERLEAFANQAALAIHNARLLQQAQDEIAERKQAEQELRASEERFRQLADNIQEVFWMTEVETGKELYMSPAAEAIWGRPVEALMNEPGAFINSVFAEDRPQLLDALEREKHGEKLEIEYRVMQPDGNLRWIWDRAFPIFDDSGQVKRIAGISADITDRREAELALLKSQSRYHELFDSSPVPIWEEDLSLVKERVDTLLKEKGTDLRGYLSSHPDQLLELASLIKITDVNQAALKLAGAREKEQLINSPTQGLNEQAILSHFQEEILGLLSPLHKFEWEGADETLDGRKIEVIVVGSIPHGYEEDWSKVIVSTSDITERKQAEQQLRKLSRAVEQTASSIIITDTSGNIEYVNPKFTEVTGYSYEEAIGRNPRILKSGTTARGEYEQLWQTIIAGHEWHGELLNRKKNGELFWESVTISPILNDRGEITHFVGVKEEITQRKQNEIETRRHVTELEAVYENGLAVGRLLEPGEIGNRVIETFARYLPWHHVTIRLRKVETDDLELVAFNLPNLKEEERTDAEQHFVARINKVGQGLSGWVIQTGMSLRTGNVHMHPQYIDTHAGIQSGLYMPLRVAERVVGVISVESETPDAFSEQDERLLATLANQTAIAFENARLYEAMQKELVERKRVEGALRVSETHYRALADSITDILFEMDHDLRYTHWNKASEALTGIPAEQAIGKYMEEIFGATEEQARIKTIYQEVLESHQPKTIEETLLLSGEKRSFEINAYPSARGVSVVAKDVTDRKRTETVMQKRFELMEYSAKYSLNELMQRTVDEVSDLTSSTIGFFHFMENDQPTAEMQTWSTNALRLFKVPVSEGTHLPLNQAGVWADAVRQRGPLIQNDYESLAEKKGIPQGHVPIVREMVIPIIRNERIMAVLGVGNKAEDYTLYDLDIAARLADYAWDITERKQMEMALEAERNQLAERVEERTADLSRANSNLARALRVKDEFLANMSHELRTPLNAILGLSESLGEQIAGPLNEKQQKYISTISESGHHLLSLINDILDLAKIDAGQITLDINKVDIRSVCQASLRMIKQLAQKKNQEVSLEIDDGLGLMWADERRLKQMIVNLLGNAVKFTPEYGRLGLEVRGDEEANQISITVWDNGMGIKESDLARLFQPFVQLDAGLAREATGTGLGLALVAQMARLHGGSVNATSNAGQGSRFTIVLPWEPALALDAVSRMKITGKFSAIKIDETNKSTILLVEDTKEVVMMLKDYLELTGYRVFTAQDGVDAIVQARHVKPDLILMDIQMPRMDGFETTRKLRSDPNFRYTPIIALTALAMPHDRERCLEAGMNEYISKPVNLKALIKIIQSCLYNEETRVQ